MNKSRKSLVKPRSLAASGQHGNCYYCGQPMWTNNLQQFSFKYRITLSQAKHFQCTGEHLVSYKDGGSSAQDNIVAACVFCNLRRHRRKTILDPDKFKRLVKQRINKGSWHCVILTT